MRLELTCEGLLVEPVTLYITRGALSNLPSFLLRCGTRPYEWGT